MKRLAVLFTLLVMAIFSLLIIQGCEEETADNIPPPEFYEFSIRAGDGAVYLRWIFIGFRNNEFGVEVSYYLDGVEKVKRVFGASTMTISGLTNNESYEFTLVGYDEAGNKNEEFKFTAIPNTPFVVVSPTSSDGYSIEDGKVRIDLRFNRQADTTSVESFIMNSFIQLRSDLTEVTYSHTWLEEGMVLSILTNETKESLCSSYPCYFYLRFHFSWRGATSFYGLSDTNGMQLDADKDGYEMGEAELTFILE